MTTSKEKTHRFETSIEHHDGLNMHVVPVPGEISDALGKSNRILIRLASGGEELRRSLQSRKSGQPFVQLGKPILRAHGLRLGSKVKVALRADPEPDRLDLEAELIEALAQEPEAKKRWDTLTVGMRRSISIYISSAKRPETKAHRAAEMAEKIRDRKLYGDRKKPGSQS